MSEPDGLVDGVFSVVDPRGSVAPTTPVETKTPEKTDTTPEASTPNADKPKTETNTENGVDVIPDSEKDGQDFNRETPNEDKDKNKDVKTKDETKTEPSKTETETETETPAAEQVPEWEATLPPPPPEYTGPHPEVDPDTGQITNMSPPEYAQYIRETAKAEIRQEGYIQTVENRALDAAEQLLPEIKTNPAVRAMVENARVASILSGKQINSYEAAKQVQAALGISPDKIAAAKAEAANNAKTSITIQKNAQVETGASQTKTESTKSDKLTRRLKAGDDSAFDDLFTQWQDEGKV
jgi:hypothetical protein